MNFDIGKDAIVLVATVLFAVSSTVSYGQQSADEGLEPAAGAWKGSINTTFSDSTDPVSGESTVSKYAPLEPNITLDPSLTEQTKKPKLTVYGFGQADYIQDINRVAPAWESTLRPSRIPTEDGLFGADGEQGQNRDKK